MRKANSIRLWVGSILIILVATACFQNANGSLDSTPVAQALPSATYTFSPVPPSETPSLTPTEGPTEIPSVTPSITPSATLTATQTPLVVAQANDQPSSLELTATALVQQATDIAGFRLTQTAVSSGVNSGSTGGIPGVPGVQQPVATDIPPIIIQPTQNTGVVIPNNNTNTFLGGTCVHEVVRGENLFRLSLRYGVSVQELANVNGISNINLISVGQKITIPNCGTTGTLPPPTSTSTPSTTTGGNTGGNTGNTGGNYVCATQHYVQQYENLFGLSMTYGVPVATIAAANPDKVPSVNMIFMGDTLCIPQA